MAERIAEHYPTPTPAEAAQAIKDQAAVIFRFFMNPGMSVEERRREMDVALAPLKEAQSSRKYSLGEFEELARKSQNKALTVTYKHEANHAAQMEKTLKEMGIAVKP